MDAKNVKRVFEDFLNNSKTEYAILLNGKWGSGKTFFWKKELIEIVRAKKLQPIYITLNGIKDINTIKYKIILEYLNSLSKKQTKALKKVSNFFQTSWNIGARFLGKPSLEELSANIQLSENLLSEYFICFDDFERCLIQPSETLGFINNYVEHYGLKIIILSDESKVEDKNNKYHNIKEKTIGRIITFQPKTESILKELITSIRNTNEDFFAGYDNFILQVISESKVKNLRTISFFLETLERLYPFIKGNQNDKIFKQIILFTAIISFEFKNGKLKTSDSGDSRGLEGLINSFNYYNFSKQMLESESSGNDDQKEYYIEVYEKYLPNLNQFYSFFNSIYRYILIGYLDEKLFKKEIIDREPKHLSQEDKDFEKLISWQFRNLANDEFKYLTGSVLNNWKEGKYNIYEYPSLLSFFLFFADNGLIEENVEAIIKLSEEALEVVGDFQVNEREMDNILHFEASNPEVDSYRKKIKAIHDKRNESNLIELTKELISSLKSDINKVELILKGNELKPILNNAKVQDFFENIIQINNESIVKLNSLLKHRYRVGNIRDYLGQEYKFIEQLKDKIEDYKNNDNIGQPKQFLLSELTQELEKICMKLL